MGVRYAAEVPSESAEQQWVMQWARAMSGGHPELDLLYHIPNEGKRSRATGARLKAEGLKSGVPDLCLPVARGGWHGLYIELKRQKGGVVTRAQMEWLEALRAQGYAAVVCMGALEACDAIERYLGGEWRGER